ncbi:helix-turn-helix domain-containing protein [Nonomuraea sp. NPDC049714]|uniref:helix-turn-helix domain-containing protein n=1 Tax=Nonomuraea sp. NPDC049714 TaxID=3364357 RepID=UPI003787884E
MKLRYNYRLYPDAPQRARLARLFGCVRAVWNDGPARRKAAWKNDRARISARSCSRPGSPPPRSGFAPAVPVMRCIWRRSVRSRCGGRASSPLRLLA